MAKGKDSKSVQNRHAYSRISYLYQAAALFASPPSESNKQSSSDSDSDSDSKPNPDNNQPITHTATTTTTPKSRASSSPRDIGTSRRLLADLRSVSLKTQIRLTPNLKRTVCKFCDTLLVEGATCATTAENPSKGGRKPWAEVLVRRCATCGNKRVYPIGMMGERQKRRPAREGEDKRRKKKRGRGGDVTMEELEEGEILK